MSTFFLSQSPQDRKRCIEFVSYGGSMSVTGYLVALGFVAACAADAEGRAEDEQRKALHASGKGGL
jgi:hypothetical protein